MKLLILGISHYDDDSPDATIKWTRKHIEKKPDRFWSHVEQVVVGHPLDIRQRRKFWHSVAFSNLIQEPLRAVGAKPTMRQWERARSAFGDIVAYTKPDIIFVFGVSAWDHLPDDYEYPGSKNLGDGVYLYQIDERYRVLAGVFNHPRNPVRERAYWHTRSKRLIRQAESLVRNQR